MVHRLCTAAAAGLALANVATASVPTNETFDTLPPGTTFVSPQRGWGADSASIVVTIRAGGRA